jgi:hypothetical protein
MKMLKNIVRLLVLTSLGLSVTPLTTANAATAIQVDKSSELGISTVANDSLDTAVPASADTTTTSTNDPTKATSNVSVTVLSGILTLEAVPNFNFGSVMQGSTAKLKNNTVDTTGYNSTDKTKPITAGEDGNNNGLLEVIDSRNKTDKMPGFTLSASMGPLKTVDSDTTTADLNAVLHLSAIPLLDGDKNNVSTSSTDQMTKPASIDSSKADSTATVMNLESGSYNAGIISASFTTPDSASLHVLGSGDNTKQSAKNMNAVITWTLTAKPTVTTTTK